VRESTQSWREVLLGVKARGMNAAKLATGDGAMDFWAALTEVYPSTKHQRCWMHKSGNVLSYLPESIQVKAKVDLHQIWMAEGRAQAEHAMSLFEEKYGAKYRRAVECLTKDRGPLLAKYDFPAEHWLHIRTTNPIESTFATLRHRTKRVKGAFSKESALAMMLQLALEAQKRWPASPPLKSWANSSTGSHNSQPDLLQRRMHHRRLHSPRPCPTLTSHPCATIVTDIDARGRAPLRSSRTPHFKVSNTRFPHNSRNS